MISLADVFQIINTELTPTVNSLGFSVVKPEKLEKGDTNVPKVL